jgi:hypothetical protein
LVVALGCGGGGGTTSTSSSGETTTSSGSGGTSSSISSSTTSSSSGTGGATSSSGTGGLGGAGGASTTSGTGGAGGGCQVVGATCASSADCCGNGVCAQGACADPATLDQDGDGWTPADGDCCDVVGSNCQNPELVNPGAFEYPGNGVDDDCDPTTPDLAPPPSCSTGALFSGVTGDDLVKAMELCQFTAESPPLSQKKWGVIQTKLLLADGTTSLPTADNVQVGVLTSYGTNVLPQKYTTMAAISSGTARTPADPGYVHPQNGTQAGQTGNFNGNTKVTIQSSYLAPHGGKPPAPAACSAACTTGCDQAYDSVNLWARIRVPTNAKSFSYQFKFYSAEFPEYLCQKYNDFFIALLKSSWTPDPNAMPPQQPLPTDGNIAFDANKNPVSVNNSFFQVCFPPSGAPAGTCPSGTLDLVGNGMGGWGNNLKDGGGTDWLTNTAPVVPGETIELQFVVWDAGDHNVDSLVLLDHFRWSVTPSPVGVSK